ncbi:MAG: DUF4863 family protein [Candidatus Protistobacter heckmanni]|nr:DUF4863 family protein [Candidatus Protistobacter heckmanni]
MSAENFKMLISAVTASIAGRALDADLQAWLNDEYPPSSSAYRDIFQACRDAIAEGWLCKHEGGGIKYGRVIKHTPDIHGFSVDVVDMNDIADLHHSHSTGEVDLVMPLTRDAQFDGQSADWNVYPAGSTHSPAVRGGRALARYLLPEGRIEFTKA